MGAIGCEHPVEAGQIQARRRDERGPSDDLRLQFEAISQLPPEEMRVVKEVIEGLIIKYQSRRWDSGRQSAA